MPSAAPSALQSYLASQTPLADSTHSVAFQQLALQIAHNLRFQHNWTDVRVHAGTSLPRPLISGLPPRRLYVHPNEQLELLQKQKDEGKTGMPDVPSETEWVLPSHLREKWSLKHFGDIFDVISVLPGPDDGEALFDDPEYIEALSQSNQMAEKQMANIAAEESYACDTRRRQHCGVLHCARRDRQT